MVQMNEQLTEAVGSDGSIVVRLDDEISRKFLMLIEGECEGLGPSAAARKFGYTRQRYDQVRRAYLGQGAPALASRKRGPKTNYRRTDEVVRQIVRHRFLDPEASAQVIAQKLRQCDWTISSRTVERVLALYGLQKKTPRVSPKR